MSRHDEIRESYKQLGSIGTMYDGIITRTTLLGTVNALLRVFEMEIR